MGISKPEFTNGPPNTEALTLEGKSPELVGLKPPVAGLRFVLPAGETLIGRHGSCDLVIRDASVSRKHAKLRVESGQLEVIDLESINGVFLGRRRVKTSSVLKSGDRLKIGAIPFRVFTFADTPSSSSFHLLRRWPVLQGWGLGALVLLLGLLFWGLLNLMSGGGTWFSTRTRQDWASLSPNQPGGEDSRFPHVLQVSTATSPWSEVGSDGLPLDLPAVDPSVDLMAKSQSQLSIAKAAWAAGDHTLAIDRAKRVLEWDPVSPEAHELIQLIRQVEAARKAQTQANNILRGGDMASASEQLTITKGEAIEAQSARRRGQRLQAKQTLKSRDTKPHRDKKVSDIDQTIEDRFKRKKAEVVDEYRQGNLEAAQALARRLKRQSPAAETVFWIQLIHTLDNVEKQFRRIRTELANNTLEAKRMLKGLEKSESKILPRFASSYLAKELRVDLAKALANEGDVLFDVERYGEAFDRWNDAHDLDPTNPRSQSGLVRLEALAKSRVKEAQLAAHKGDKGKACDRYREITRMTRSQADIHHTARKKAFQVCP